MDVKNLSDRQILEALYEKAYKPRVTPFDSVDSGPQMEPVKPARVPVQLNAFPEPGILYPNDNDPVPDGHHKEYDWGNHEIVYCKNCGPLGSR